MARSLFLLLIVAATSPLGVSDDLVVRKEKPRKLLVLNNGQVVDGHLSPRTDGYDVVLPAGRMYVSNNNIRFIATSMQDAYDKMSASLPQKTPSVHVQMARWCLRNQLQKQARRELLDALHLDPDYTTARTMLESLARRKKKIEQSEAQRATKPASATVQSADVVDRRSLGGLPAEAARTFAVSIQTLISNRCGNTRCHGGDRNEFQFTHTGRGSTVVIAEQNLAAVLKQIDVKEPAESPLLKYAESMHGGARSPLFNGRTGRSQLQLLKDWVKEISIEINPALASAARQKPSPANLGDSALQRSDDAVTMVSHRASSDVRLGDEFKMRPKRKSDTDKQFGQAARQATRKDPFDPMIFNHRYHGGTRPSR